MSRKISQESGIGSFFEHASTIYGVLPHRKDVPVKKQPVRYHLALLTGGSSGIGRAVAARLVASGTSVIIVARNLERLNTTKAYLESIATGAATIRILSLDVSDNEAVGRLIPPCLDEAGTPDLLYVGAGIACPDHFENITQETYRHTMNINIDGAWNILSLVIPRMKAAGGGTIVNVSSMGGLLGTYGYTAYSASKFALMGLSQCLRNELKPDRIDVKVLCPPDTDTPQLTTEEKTKPDETRRITGNAPVLTPDEVAGVLMKGLRSSNFVLIPGFVGKIGWWTYRLAPGIVHRLFDRDVRLARDEPK